MKHPEQDLQIAVASFLAVALPDDVFWTAINPLPGKAGKATAGLRKVMGLRAGVADLMFVYQGRIWFIELKAKTGRESAAQESARELAERAGAPTRICRGLEDVETRLRYWGVPLRASILTSYPEQHFHSDAAE